MSKNEILCFSYLSCTELNGHIRFLWLWCWWGGDMASQMARVFVMHCCASQYSLYLYKQWKCKSICKLSYLDYMLFGYVYLWDIRSSDLSEQQFGQIFPGNGEKSVGHRVCSHFRHVTQTQLLLCKGPIRLGSFWFIYSTRHNTWLSAQCSLAHEER